MIIWLVKQLFIKLGWAKPSSGAGNCSLTAAPERKIEI
jgi:hypothetical protein